MPRSTRLMLTAVVVIAFGGALALAQNGEQKKPEPKHKIKDVMKEAMKGGLNKKVVSGKATMEEKLALLDMFVSLVENDPPVGEKDSWQRMSGSAALAAAKVAVGREGAENELKTATNCAACHKLHKPKTEE